MEERTEMRRQRWCIIPVLLMLTIPVLGQPIPFGSYVQQGITLSGTAALDFNEKQTVIFTGSNQVISIGLQESMAAYLQLSGNSALDVTITVSADDVLTVDGGGAGKQIPFSLHWAYSNTGGTTPEAAKVTAVEVPAGYSAATFPVSKNSTGIPPPPPTPAHGGYQAPTGTAYLFFYGSIGPIPSVQVGGYTGTIAVTVEYN